MHTEHGGVSGHLVTNACVERCGGGGGGARHKCARHGCPTARALQACQSIVFAKQTQVTTVLVQPQNAVIAQRQLLP